MTTAEARAAVEAGLKMGLIRLPVEQKAPSAEKPVVSMIPFSVLGEMKKEVEVRRSKLRGTQGISVEVAKAAFHEVVTMIERVEREWKGKIAAG